MRRSKNMRKTMKRSKGMAVGGKPDFLDLDKDGNKEESMKVAAMQAKRRKAAVGGKNTKMTAKGRAVGGKNTKMKAKGMAVGGKNTKMKAKGRAVGGKNTKMKAMYLGGMTGMASPNMGRRMDENMMQGSTSRPTRMMAVGGKNTKMKAKGRAVGGKNTKMKAYAMGAGVRKTKMA